MTPISISAQAVSLINPSFEDIPGVNKPPFGWYSCGDYRAAAPDVQPTAVHGVTQSGAEGDTYLGLVTRADGTCETIGQRLTTALRAGRAYRLSGYVRRSPVMLAHVAGVARPVYLTDTCVLRVGGSTARCAEPLWWQSTKPVARSNWQSFHLVFSPSEDAGFLLLGAYFTDSGYTYANVQVDGLALHDITDSGMAIPFATSPTLPDSVTQQPEGGMPQTDQKLLGDHLNNQVFAATVSPGSNGKVDTAIWLRIAEWDIGIRARNRVEFRTLRRAFRQRWIQPRKLLGDKKVRFFHLRDGVEESDWTYHAGAAYYWLRWPAHSGNRLHK